MYLIYGKGVVASGVAHLCDQKNIAYRMRDDSDGIEDFSDYEAIIPSPGVPGTHRIYQTGKIISELDFAQQFAPENTIFLGITGTDGKSTTAWMLYSILEKYYSGKKKVYISGNFETPLSQTINTILEEGVTDPIIVVEISSFMAHYIGKSTLPAFSPDYTIFTNLSVDHLNWHRNLWEYADAKLNLLYNTKKNIIVNNQVLDFLQTQNIFWKIDEKKCILFGDSTDYFVKNDDILVMKNQEMMLSQTNFSGLHNAYNILSVMIVLGKMGLQMERVRDLWREVFGLPHRLEDLGKHGKVRVIEDSKSSSAQSLAAALGAFGLQKNILLIVGGSDKGDTFSHLAPAFRARVSALAAIGATKQHFVDIAREQNIEYLATDSLSEAVDFLYQLANEDDILLLSPGCASFGLFRDYLHRAEVFREVIACMKK